MEGCRKKAFFVSAISCQPWACSYQCKPSVIGGCTAHSCLLSPELVSWNLGLGFCFLYLEI